MYVRWLDTMYFYFANKIHFFANFRNFFAKWGLFFAKWGLFFANINLLSYITARITQLPMM